jgi:hypothetical protein
MRAAPTRVGAHARRLGESVIRGPSGTVRRRERASSVCPADEERCAGMGVPGHGSLHHALIGSVSDDGARASTLPILHTRRQAPPLAAGG